MKDMGWIYLLLFVVLPLLKRFMDSRTSAKRKETRRSTRQRSRRDVSWPPSAAEAEDEPLTVAEMEEEEEGWIAADPRPVDSSPPPLPAEIPTLSELGGGWVDVPEVASGHSTTTTPEAMPVRPARLPRADHHGVPPHPLDVLAQLRQQMQQDAPAAVSEPAPYQVEDLASDPVHGPDAYSLSSDAYSLSSDAYSQSSSARAQHGKLKHGSGQRWRLSRSELRNRLVWREILGPPVCLREPE